MTSRGSLGAGLALGLLLGGVIMFGALQGRAQTRRATTRPAAAAPATDIAASRRSAIVSAAQRVSPAVVSVGVTSTRVVRMDPFGGMFRDDFFDQFFPQQEYRQRQQGMGSGFVVDRSGRILTNEHVVRNADSVTATLPDGRVFRARVLAASATYDLAVLDIDGNDLPVAPLGDSDDLVVGEWAIAIGNPFGQFLLDPSPTVTAGVISAKGRDIKSEVTDTGLYKNMIQTDAAINPGNSGGPLVNGLGEVIGVNTFIFTSGGGNLGMGFAVPINLARRVMAEVETHGRIRVAYPGFQIQPVTARIAEALGWSGPGGLVVARVDPSGPAARAGLEVRDRIRRVNGRTVDTIDDAQRSIYGAGVGDRLALSIERGGRSREIVIVLEEAPRGRP